MRHAAPLIALALAGLLLAGCTPGPAVDAPSPVTATAAGQDLRVQVTVQPRTVRIGEPLHVSLIATNTSEDQPVTITSRTGALMLVTVWEHDNRTWQQVRQYPEAAIQVLSPWTLGPGESRTFEMTVPVEPGWPEAKRVRITAHLNGRPQLQPGVITTVLPRAPQE